MPKLLQAPSNRINNLLIGSGTVHTILHHVDDVEMGHRIFAGGALPLQILSRFGQFARAAEPECPAAGPD
jgi:hypothetical protein